MKKKLTIKRGLAPKTLTEYELQVMDNFVYLPGWQFDDTIRPRCIFIQEPLISGFYHEPEEGKSPTYKSVIVYGLVGIGIKSGEMEISNIFVRYDERLYQFGAIESAFELVEILRKDLRRREYIAEKWKESKKQLKAA